VRRLLGPCRCLCCAVVRVWVWMRALRPICTRSDSAVTGLRACRLLGPRQRPMSNWRAWRRRPLRPGQKQVGRMRAHMHACCTQPSRGLLLHNVPLYFPPSCSGSLRCSAVCVRMLTHASTHTPMHTLSSEPSLAPSSFCTCTCSRVA